ncbi:MAG: AraC family transcriptional regulator [Rhizobiales bacterium]|nr:AraC family transcriptional regulator [Hyphomicrobiales bacterium]
MTCADPRPSSRAAAYARRVERAVAALHADLDRPWRLDDLAAVACFSPYHFHRVYRAMMGETPDETRRRLLLHRAAGELIHSARDVAAIARRAGYGSAAAFSRAFSASYGRPPAAYRLSREGAGAFADRRNEETVMQHATPNAYETTLADEPPRVLIGLPHAGSYMQIGQAFERLGALAFGAGLDPRSPMIGVYYDDPHSVPEARLRSFAGLEVDVGVAVPAGLERRELPGGPVAGIVHKGPYAELPQAYDWLYGQWLPASGREPADSPAYEIYLNDPAANPPTEWLTRVVVPLKA